jgi:transcription elongation factor GreA-like protein
VYRKLEVYIDSESEELARLFTGLFPWCITSCLFPWSLVLLFQELEEVSGIEELEKEISRRIKRREAANSRS